MNRRQKARYLLERGDRAQSRGRFDKAALLYQASLSCHPTAEACTLLGWVCSLQGDLERAIALCRWAIALDPSLGNPYADLGAYLIEMERYTEARMWLGKALFARRYTSPNRIHYNLGRIYEHLGEEGRAIAAYRAALAYSPQSRPLREAYLRLISRTN